MPTSTARFISENLADICSSLTATSAAGSLVVANLLIDERDATWRSTSLAAQTLDMRWTVAQAVDSVCFAWTNLTSAATVQIKGYTNVGDPVAVFDQTVSPDTALDIGNVTVQNWLAASYNIKQLKTIITDAANPDGFVEASRQIVGLRWSPDTNVSRDSFAIDIVDMSKADRAESGDLVTERLSSYRRMELSLDLLTPSSRDKVIAMISKGLGSGVWVSVMPEAADASTQQFHAFWGALVEGGGPFRYPRPNRWSRPLVFEEMATRL